MICVFDRSLFRGVKGISTVVRMTIPILVGPIRVTNARASAPVSGREFMYGLA